MPSSAQPLDPDFRDMLGQLLKHRVEFLLIGAHALAAHGFPRYTGDMDLVIRPSAENAQRLWRALGEFGAPLGQLSPDDFTRPQQVVQFGVPPHRIDFTTSLTGVENFDDAWTHRITVQIEGMPVPVLGKAEMIRNKRATGRPRDVVDADLLSGESSQQPPPKKSR